MSPSDPQIATSEIDTKALAQKALAHVRRLCDGNGATSDSIQIKEASGEILFMEGITHIEVSSDTTQERKNGKQVRGTLLPKPEALPLAIQEHLTKITKNDEARKVITGKLLNRADKGFSSHGEIIELPEFSFEYTIHEPCKSCHGEQATTCQRCNGRRHETCTQCRGVKMIPCRNCGGSGFKVGQDGKQQQCNFCFGQRQVGCPLCAQRGVIKCRICKGTGASKCNTCKGEGFFSVFTKLSVAIKTLFEMDRTSVPHPAVWAIENMGTKLAAKGHIDMSADAVKREDGGMAIQYKAYFPYGDIVFNINGKPIKAHIFGKKGKLLKLKPFLEEMIEPGMRHLTEAARGQGGVANKIKKASQYKLLGHAMIFAATMKKKKAMIALKKKYPMGIGNEALQKIIRRADQALGNVTRKPRYIGLIIGILLAGALYASLFTTTAYAKIVASLPNVYLEMIFAGALIGLSGYAIGFLIKHIAVKAMNKAIGHMLPENAKMAAPPKARTSGLYAYIGAAIMLLVVIEISRHLSFFVPRWYPL